MKRLKQQLQAEKIRFVENESLAAHCTFKIGGPADVFVQPETEEQLCRVIALCKACSMKSVSYTHLTLPTNREV